MFLFFGSSYAQQPCDFNIYRYKSNSICIKFDCDTVQPFSISIKNQLGKKVDNIYYKPKIKENIFFITFTNEEDGIFNIDIQYNEVNSSFFYIKN